MVHLPGGGDLRRFKVGGHRVPFLRQEPPHRQKAVGGGGAARKVAVAAVAKGHQQDGGGPVLHAAEMGQPVVAQQHGVVEGAERGLFHPEVFGVLFFHRLHGGPPGPHKAGVIRHGVGFKEAQRPVPVQRQLPGGEGGQGQGGQLFFAAFEAAPQPDEADARRQQAAGQQPAPPAVGLGAEEVDQHPQRRRQRPGGKAPFQAHRPGEGPRAPRVSSRNTSRKLSR